MTTPLAVGQLSRPFPVARLPSGGVEVEIVATRAECAALALDFKLPALRSLSATLRVTGAAGHVRVVGRLVADIVQTCVVTLDDFESRLEQEIEADFTEPHPEGRRDDPRADIDLTEDEPDEIVDGRIDLGSLTAEFLALGLDPHPRKPGITFEYEGNETGENPFSRLADLKRDGD